MQKCLAAFVSCTVFLVFYVDQHFFLRLLFFFFQLLRLTNVKSAAKLGVCRIIRSILYILGACKQPTEKHLSAPYTQTEPKAISQIIYHSKDMLTVFFIPLLQSFLLFAFFFYFFSLFFFVIIRLLTFQRVYFSHYISSFILKSYSFQSNQCNTVQQAKEKKMLMLCLAYFF